MTRQPDRFLTRGKRAHQPPPHLLRRRLDFADRVEHLEDVSHDSLPLVDVRQFTAAKHHRHDDLVLVLQKPFRLVDLEFDVVLTRLRTETNLLDLRVVNVSLVLFLLLLIFELAEIHDSADGRLFVGSHLHQIQTGFPGEAERLLGGDDAELPAFGGDDPNRSDPNLLVDAVLLLYGSRLRTRTRSARPGRSRTLRTRHQRHSSEGTDGLTALPPRARGESREKQSIQRRGGSVKAVAVTGRCVLF
jgi:hypothetical protein